MTGKQIAVAGLVRATLTGLLVGWLCGGGLALGVLAAAVVGEAVAIRIALARHGREASGG